jgi:hypothetical protein
VSLVDIGRRTHKCDFVLLALFLGTPFLRVQEVGCYRTEADADEHSRYWKSFISGGDDVEEQDQDIRASPRYQAFLILTEMMP